MERRASWQVIMDLTESMQHAAVNGLWEEVIQTEKQRQDLISSFFKISPTEEEAQWLGSGIIHLLEQDKKIMSLGKSDLEKIGQEISSVRRGQIAKTAYQVPV